jgi:hypothetical protein
MKIFNLHTGGYKFLPEFAREISVGGIPASEVATGKKRINEKKLKKIFPLKK